MEWSRKSDKTYQRQKFHGKYVLLTSLDEKEEMNIRKFYNVIRTVKETFHTLKTDIDIRPVYHKSDGGIKAHLNLAVLAYWVVSVTKYRLKLKKYPNVRCDEKMRIFIENTETSFRLLPSATFFLVLPRLFRMTFCNFAAQSYKNKEL